MARSALIVEVPWAEPVAGPWRRDHDPVSHRGIPAQITILGPFRPPHGGRFAPLTPHLTLAQGPDPELIGELRRRAEAELAGLLPVAGTVDGLSLFVSDDDDTWRRTMVFPFG